MKKLSLFTTSIVLMLCFSMCRKANPTALDDENNFDPRLSGGAATAFDLSARAFSNMMPGMTSRDQYIHELGDKLFEQPYVAAPAPRFGGLGPIFNNVSCLSCHHNDGIGIPTAGATNSSLLIRLSLPGQDEHGGPVAVPGFGLQLQDVGLFGIPAEATVNISYTELPYTFPDGETVSLRKPSYTLSNSYIPLPPGYLLSPRMAPPIFGLGLLENVSDATILSLAAAQGGNSDGITGKPNYVYDPYTHKKVIGRFGLKANTSTLLLQVATAFQQDMGLTSYVQPNKSVANQMQMQYVKNNGKPDLADSSLNAVCFYIQSLAVPARRDVENPVVKQGEQLFAILKCNTCHTPTMYTDVNVALPTISHQRIHPYSDLLLHDMGDELGDNRPDFEASGNEWRTAPLWGIGLFPKANGVPYYLHDGRARTLTEAILWHNGEAGRSKEQYTRLSKSERDAVIAFLQSL